MASFSEIEQQVNAMSAQGAVALDLVRRQSIQRIAKITKRNVIAYYSAFITRRVDGVEINDMDVNGFMNVVHGMDRKLGLDLLLHTPGGGITATERIVQYLKELFKGDIRCIVPQMAMSAGTMTACAAREIIMGRQSCLGPIDPQYYGVPCHGVVEEFEKAAAEIKTDPSRMGVWQPVIQKYKPTFLGECQKAIELSEMLVDEWLRTGMFKDDLQAKKKAQTIVKWLGSHKNTKTHDRHISAADAKTIGLNVRMLEDDQDLQDAVLSAHHCYMMTFSRVKVLKIFESSHGRQFAMNG